MYYLVISKTDNFVQIVRTTASLAVMKRFYTSFYKNTYTIISCWLPESFLLSIIPPSTNHIKLHRYELAIQFSKWCYVQGKNTVTNYYNLMKHYVEMYIEERNRVNGLVFDEDDICDDGNNDVTENKQTESCNKETDTEQDKIQDKIQEKTIEDAVKLVHDVIKKNDDAVCTPTEIEGYNNSTNAIFRKKRSTQLCHEYFAEIEKDMSFVKGINDLSEYKIIIRFVNAQDKSVGVTTFSHDDMTYLRNLGSIGITDIKYDDVAFFPFTPIIDSLVEQMNLADKSKEDFILAVLKIRKFLFEKGSLKTVIIKSFLERIHSMFEFDFNSTIPLKDFADTLQNDGAMAIYIMWDVKMCSACLEYLGYQVHDGKINFLKKRTTPISIRFNIDVEVQSLLKTSYVSKINYDLRAPPQIPKQSINSPWNLSSHDDGTETLNNMGLKLG
jgi:hypothetical protein